MSISKPDQIKWLEKQIGVPLHPLRRGSVTDYQNRTCYELDADGQIVGLNLAFCRIIDGHILTGMPRLTALNLNYSRIADGLFLKEMKQLHTLNLGANEITDWSFLAGMKQLHTLDLNSNKITDGSFLKELKQLTSLNLFFNNIIDGSFLKGMNQLSSLCLSSTNITDGSFLRALNQLSSLNLFFTNLSDWSFLKRINQLRYLNLSGNKITDWSFLNEMKYLNTLCAQHSNITDGSFLKGMNQLLVLDLNNNKISDWSFLIGLNQLVKLDLGSNSISRCSFLKKMNKLTMLDLRFNNITDWSFLNGMRQLSSLSLRSNTITDGSFLEGMTQLTDLDISSNNITDGSFLKGMPRLTALDLKFNNITDWSFLRWMTQLTELDISSNNITDGSFLKGMYQLSALYLNSNKIADWSFLEKMNQLATLEIKFNSIDKINISFLDKCLEVRSDHYNDVPYSINVYGNPLEEPPLEIIERGHASTMSWYHASREGEIDINEVKIILVGDGGSGKTTVRKRLMELPGNANESQTHGIEIHDHEIPCQGRPILTHFWDFGGQEIMHATHQFFLSRRSLYILLLDGRKEEDAEYWLKHIESFGGDSPILVCLNKIDQHPSFEVDRKNLKEKHPSIRDFCRLRCLKEDDAEVKRLIAELPQHIANVEMLQSKWPQKWAKVKGRLLKDDKPFVDRSEFAALCEEEGIEEEKQQQTLIRFLNDLGIALHFDDRRLRLLQILNPRWATQAVYRIINDPGTAGKRGVLALDGLPAILKTVNPDDFAYPQDKLNYIADLMKRFELCHELTHDSVLLPDLLGIQEPKFTFPKADILRFRFQYDYLPSSILPRMIVQMHNDTDGDLRWRTGIVLKKKDGRARAVIRSDRHNKQINIEVEGRARRDYFAAIRDRFDKIHSEFQKFAVEEQVPLPDHPDLVVKYSDLLFSEEEKQKFILVGSIKKKYNVVDLLNGIEPKEKRQARKRSGKPGSTVYAENYYEGGHMGDNFNPTIGNVSGGTFIIGKNINHVTAEKIENSFNKATGAVDRSQDIRDLLQALAREMAKIVEKLPSEKAEEAANDLATITEESIKEKPAKKYWDLSKKGIIEAAQAVGVVGKTAIDLVTKLGPLLGWT